MMVIDFTPALYLFEWGLVVLLVIAGGGIIACLGSAEREAAYTWVETSDFLRSLRAAGAKRRGIHWYAERTSKGRSSVSAGARGSSARC